MLIIAFDPGFNYTGWATVTPDSMWGEAGEENSSAPLLARLEDLRDSDDEVTVVIESYLGAGYMTKEAKRTVGMVFLLQQVAEYWGFNVKMRPPQARLSAVREAQSQGYPKDATAALAHAIAYSRMISSV